MAVNQDLRVVYVVEPLAGSLNTEVKNLLQYYNSRPNTFQITPVRALQQEGRTER